MTGRQFPPHARPTPSREPTPTPRLARHAATCEYRALTTSAELIESFRLRHDVYSALGYLERASASGLEIDAFDLVSIPFGAFDPETGAIIGTLRLITTEISAEYEHLIACALGEICDRTLTDQALAPRSRVLPSIISDPIAHAVAAFNAPQYPVYELSRFILHPGYRGAGISRGLVLLAMTHAMRSSHATLLASCLADHIARYERYGFLRLPDTELDYFDSVGQIANAIIARTDHLPEPFRSELDDLVTAAESDADDCRLEFARDTRALFRFVSPHRVQRRTREW